jgi:hypothetical protein
MYPILLDDEKQMKSYRWYKFKTKSGFTLYYANYISDHMDVVKYDETMGDTRSFSVIRWLLTQEEILSMYEITLV